MLSLELRTYLINLFMLPEIKLFELIKTKVGKSDLLDTIEPLESLCYVLWIRHIEISLKIELKAVKSVLD